jgi:hypothetical protein
MLSSPALDLLRRARERLTNQPTSTLWLAAFHEDHAPRPSLALGEIASLPAELLELSGAEELAKTLEGCPLQEVA